MENETNLNDVERFNAVDVLKVVEIIKKPSTNFERITASPEKLAEFIKTIIDVCYTCDRNEYPQCTICWCNPIALKNWLMAEVKE